MSDNPASLYDQVQEFSLIWLKKKKNKKVVTCLAYSKMNRPRKKSKNLSPNCLLSEHLEQGG